MAIFKNQKGQIFVEYMLLVVVAATVAGIMIKQFAKIGDDPDSSGFVVKKIWKIQEEIGRDIPQ